MIFFKVSKYKKYHQLSWKRNIVDKWTVEDIFEDWRDIPTAKVAVLEYEKKRIIADHETMPHQYSYPKFQLDEINNQIKKIKSMAQEQTDIDYIKDATDFQDTEPKRGWWELKLVGVDELDDNSKEHIADLIRDGYKEGEIIIQ